MRNLRTSTLIIGGQSALLLLCAIFLVRALWHNFFLTMEAKEFAAKAGFMAATQDFVRDRRELYDMQLYKFDIEKDSGTVPTDSMTRPTGRSEGPFQIRALLVDQQYPAVHQEVVKAYVDAYNQHTRQIYEKPQWFDSRGNRIPSPSKRSNTN